MIPTGPSLAEALSYADRNWPESLLAPENELYADLAVEAYMAALRTTPWIIVQRRVSDHGVESVIARFQHEQLAHRFILAIEAVTDHYLTLETV